MSNEDNTLPNDKMTFPSFTATIPLMQAGILNPAEEYLWEEFVRNHSLGNINQTPEWGHFQAKIPGRGKYWIIALTESSRDSTLNNSSTSRPPKILAGTLLIRHQLPKGYCWLYAPRGPLLNYDNHELANQQMSALMTEIKKIAGQEKGIFLRIDPLITPSRNGQIHSPNSHQDIASHSASSSQPALHFPNFRQNISGFQPDHTLILDLTKSEQELLAQMKPKGRYNIKLAEKKGVTIRKAGLTNGSESSNPVRFEKDLTAFYKILTETTSRDGFHGHDLKFYKDMLESLDTNATLYLAEFDNQIIAACLNTFYKDTAIYYYGASGSAHRNIMAPYLLHWQAIRDAKQKGCKFYDFFGIAPTHEQSECASQQTSRLGGTNPKRPKGAEAKMNSHPWAGVTEFKKKFGGTEVSYQKPQELPFKTSLYFLYRAYKKLR